MLNVALVGLLAGSLAIGGGDSKNPQSGDKPAADNAVPGIFISSDASASETPDTVQDTYAFGMANRNSPIRLWANYAQGDASRIWDTNGDTQFLTLGGTQGKIVSRRADFGGELGLPVGLFGVGLGVGAQLTLAQNEFEVTDGAALGVITAGGTGDVSGDFGLQQVKVYGTGSAGPITVHGGYVFDLGKDREYAQGVLGTAAGGAPAGTPLSVNAAGVIRPTALVTGVAGFTALQFPTRLATSDGRDAAFVGASFDYPSERFRLFGGLDYYMLFQRADEPETAANENLYGNDNFHDDFINANIGGGVRLSILEVGASVQIQSRYTNPTVLGIGTAEGIGSFAATVSPYLRLSPPQIPASIYVKGAVRDEYTEYGQAMGGGNSIKPAFGFTVGLSVGFD